MWTFLANLGWLGKFWNCNNPNWSYPNITILGQFRDVWGLFLDCCRATAGIRHIHPTEVCLSIYLINSRNQTCTMHVCICVSWVSEHKHGILFSLHTLFWVANMLSCGIQLSSPHIAWYILLQQRVVGPNPHISILPLAKRHICWPTSYMPTDIT